ncbi:unnamed protein product, partial [Polarella glacialis]
VLPNICGRAFRRPAAVRRLAVLKRKRPKPRAAQGTTQKTADVSAAAVAGASQLTEIMRRNIALEAVRQADFYSEDKSEVLRYIAEVHQGLLADSKFMSKLGKMKKENGLSRRYTVEQILQKTHEADGFNVFVDPDEAIYLAEKTKKDAERTIEAIAQAELARLSSGDLAEIQEGVDFVAAAASGEGDPVGIDEVIELLERCARGGE